MVIETQTLLNAIDMLITVMLVGTIIWDMIKIHQMRELIKGQQLLIELQHRIILVTNKSEQVKCYGSTEVSKTSSEGSTPSTCANNEEAK